MRYRDLVDILESRARTIVLPHDAMDWMLLLYQGLQELADRWDFDAFTVPSDMLFQTDTGAPAYPMPEGFSRLIHPTMDERRLRQTWGIELWNGTALTPLTYYAPAIFWQRRSTTNGPPQEMTVMGRTIHLSPPPDSNSGANYTGRGVYIGTIERPGEDDIVPLGEPSQLLEYVLGCAVLDSGKPQGVALHQKGTAALSTLANHQANQRLRMYRSRERIGQWGR